MNVSPQARDRERVPPGALASRGALPTALPLPARLVLLNSSPLPFKV